MSSDSLFCQIDKKLVLTLYWDPALSTVSSKAKTLLTHQSTLIKPHGLLGVGNSDTSLSHLSTKAVCMC